MKLNSIHLAKFKTGVRVKMVIPDDECVEVKVRCPVGDTQLVVNDRPIPVNIIMIGDDKRCFFCNRPSAKELRQKEIILYQVPCARPYD